MVSIILLYILKRAILPLKNDVNALPDPGLAAIDNGDVEEMLSLETVHAVGALLFKYQFPLTVLPDTVQVIT